MPLSEENVATLLEAARKKPLPSPNKSKNTIHIEQHIHDCKVEIGNLFYYPLPQNNELHRIYKTIDPNNNKIWLTRIDLCPDEKVNQAQERVRKKVGRHYLTEQYESYTSEGELYHITTSEYLKDCMSLKKYIEQLETIGEKIKAILSTATLIGNMFEYFKKQGVYWTDLKYDNILVTLDKHSLATIHVSDIKAMCTEDDIIYANCTPEFRPPEITDATGKIEKENYPYFLRYTFGKMFESLLPADWGTSAKAQQIESFLKATLNQDPKSRFSIYDALLFLTAKPTEQAAQGAAPAPRLDRDSIVCLPKCI